LPSGAGHCVSILAAFLASAAGSAKIIPEDFEKETVGRSQQVLLQPLELT